MSDYQTSLLKVKDYLYSPKSSSTLGPSIKSRMQETVQFVERDIDKMSRDETVRASKEDHDNVVSLLHDLLEVVSHQVISGDLRVFIEHTCKILFNWNNNLNHSDRITTLTTVLDRFVVYHFTSIELLTLLKRMQSRCRSLEHFAFPPIELSKHYLDSLDLQVKKKKDLEQSSKPDIKSETKSETAKNEEHISC